MDIDALVVGAGPVGLTMAAELTRHGVRCRLVDRAPARSDKSKALVLWPRSLELLGYAGAVEPFLADGLRVVRARLFANRQPLAELRFDVVPSPHPLALMIPQSETERLLEAHLNRLGVAVERSVELLGFSAAADGVEARLRAAPGSEESVRSAWLLGCDGAHSTVRHGLGMDFAGSAEPSDWILADVHVDGPVSPDELRIDWHAEGILAFFPIGAGRYRIIADGEPSAGDRPRDPTLADVQAVLDQRGPGGVTVRDPLWLAGFRINERKVAEYRAGRVFLAGDAAHVHSPAGGQGMNTGMQDAFNLAWKLGVMHASRGREILLESYSRERSAVGDLVLRNAAAMTRVATLRNPTGQRLRNAVLPVVASLGFVRTAMSNTLSEMSINYRTSPLSRDDRSAADRARALVTGGVVAGDRAPDAAVVEARGGAATHLFELLRSGRHCLLLCSAAAAVASMQPIAVAVGEAYGDLIDVFIVAPSDAPSQTPLLVDRTGGVRAAYAVRAPTAVLIRPDGYVGYYGQPIDHARLLAHLKSYLL